MKTGEDYIRSLQDGRKVYIYGQLVNDVTTHPAFRNCVSSVAGLYDLHARFPASMTFTSPDTGSRVGVSWQLPTSYEELVQRREALSRLAETHFGFLGRSPDHVASCISGMFMGIQTFEAYDADRARALRDYYQFARDCDLFLAYALVNPQAESNQGRFEKTARIVEQNSQGIVVRGVKMVGTGCATANEVFVTTIQRLNAGNEPYAMSFAVPLSIDGLKVLCRNSYEFAAESFFDNPLASRYDENDATLFFDDVLVSWDRVFIAGDVAMCRKQFEDTPAHYYQNYQCQIRLSVKLRFLAGIARMLAIRNGIDGLPQVRESLGQLAAEAAMVESMLYAAEVKGERKGAYFLPDMTTIYAAQVLTQDLYPNVIGRLRTLAGSAVITLPAGTQGFENPELSRYLTETQGTADCGPSDDVRFLKLAWDAFGSEFASRQLQYEMFFAGASHVNRGHSLRSYDWDRAIALVRSGLSDPG